jgi:hypothetical protein
MMISTLFVLLAVPWAFGLASSFGWFINYMLALAIVVLVAHLIALATVTIQRAQRSRRTA